MQWLVADPSFSRLLMVELWLSFLYASYNGAMVVALTEVMPVDVRTAGFSLAYSLATTIGGFTPAISTYLIHVTGNKAAPGAWMGRCRGLRAGGDAGAVSNDGIAQPVQDRVTGSAQHHRAHGHARAIYTSPEGRGPARRETVYAMRMPG